MRFCLKTSCQGIITKLVILLIALLLAGLALGFIWPPKTVDLVIDGRHTRLTTQAGSVAELLASTGITFTSTDKVTPKPFTLLQEGMQVEVRHAVPVTVEADKQIVTILTTAPTVESAIKEAGITLATNDKIVPDRDTPVRPHLKVKITSVFHRLILTKAPLRYSTISKFDPTLYSYASRVETDGKNGLVLRLEDVIYEGGRRIKTVFTTERVIVSPVSQVISMGAKLYRSSAGGRTLISRGGQREKVWNMFATTYVPGHGCSFHTATGYRAGYGVVAVDPRVIPLGTYLYIEGYGPAVAADTGGSIKGTRIDLCFDSLSEAKAFGDNRMVKVHLVK